MRRYPPPFDRHHSMGAGFSPASEVSKFASVLIVNIGAIETALLIVRGAAHLASFARYRIPPVRANLKLNSFVTPRAFRFADPASIIA